MATEQELMNKRMKLIEIIKAKGGKGNAPGYTQQLNQLDKELKGMRGGAAAGPTDNTLDATAPEPINKGTAEESMGNVSVINDLLTRLAQQAGEGFKGGELDLAGAPDRATTGDLEADRSKYYEKALGYYTKDLGERRGRETEEWEQRLANRGIPIDPSQESLYGRTMGEIGKKYDTAYGEAQDKAYLQSGQEMERMSGISEAARAGYLGEQLTKRNLPLNDISTLLGSTQYGLPIESYLSKYQIDQQRKIQEAQLRARGGGGGGAAATGPMIYGGFPGGFGV